MEEKDLKPKGIVKELDKYIVGQDKAKKSVAIALRNRWRRQKVDEKLRDEIAPKNIIMIGPTGVGKTEIAKRLANLSNSPFFKVEASKFTEIGYIGRDVESMVRDLVNITVRRLRNKEEEKCEEAAEQIAIERILDLLLPKPRHKKKKKDDASEQEIDENESYEKTREKLKDMLYDGKLDNRFVDVNLAANTKSIPTVEIFSNLGLEDMETQMADIMNAITSSQSKKNKKVKVKDALILLKKEEVKNLVDMEKVVESAISLVEQSGIIFIDEIDKVAVDKSTSNHGQMVSREGVQRDMLPIVEGATVPTKFGSVKTNHILFIAAGAFHMSKPSDLIPELQGRFPIRVELDSLHAKDFVRILQEPKNALTSQYQALLETDKITISFDKDAILEISQIAEDVNATTENIGARRLHTIMEYLLEDILFNAPDIKKKKITIDKDFVKEKLKDIKADEDLTRYIL